MVGRLNPNWIGPTAPRGTSDNRFATTAFVTGGSGYAGPRVVLATTTSFFVANNGSDSNTGLSTSSPWLTLSHAINVLASQYDFGNQNVTLQAMTGNASFTSGLPVVPWVTGALTYDGAAGSIAVACTSTSGNAISVSGSLPNPFTVQNATLSTSGTSDQLFHSTGNGIYHAGVGRVVIGPNLTLATCVEDHLIATEPGGKFSGTNGYAIVGSPRFANIQLFSLAQAIFSGTITNGSQSFVAFAFIVGTLDVSAALFPNAGSATGQRFNAVLNGVINSGSRGLNLLPGSTNGSTSLQGQYL